MPDWDEIFQNQGYVFREPHTDLPKLVEFFKKHKINRVLDLGCGTGRHLVYLAREGFDVVGSDSSPNALKLAKRWLDNEDLGARILLHRMEQQFPFQDAYFDAILSVQVIHHNLFNDILKTISEIHRILREGGIIFITVPMLHDGPVPKEMDWDLEVVEPRTRLPREGPESGIPHHYFTEDGLRKAFSDFAVKNLYIDDTGHRCLLGMKK